MFQIDDPTAVAVMPTPEAAGTPGWFTDGNPATSTPATNLRSSFFNGMTKEIMNVLSEMGTTPSKTTYTQLRDSIYAMISAKSTASLATLGWQKLPSGLIVQWGSIAGVSIASGAYADNTVTFPITFPTSGLWAGASPLTGTAITFCTAATYGLGASSLHVVQGNTFSSSQTVGARWLAIGN